MSDGLAEVQNFTLRGGGELLGGGFKDSLKFVPFALPHRIF